MSIEDSPQLPNPTDMASLFPSLERVPTGTIDLSTTPCSGVDFSYRTIEDAHFGTPERRVLLAHANFDSCQLRNVSFESCDMKGISFRNAVFQAVRFQGSVIQDCDFRYATFRRTSFARADLVGCDFYRMTAELGVVFEGARLEWCSLHKADFSGSDLRLENLVTPLLHESAARLQSFHLDRGVVDPMKVSALVKRGLYDAIGTYRSLAGLWVGAGRYKDEAEAYHRMKRLERKAAWSEFLGTRHPVSRVRSLWRWVGLLIGDAIAGFGESLSRVGLTAAGVLFGTALLLALGGGIVTDPGSGIVGFNSAFRYALLNAVAEQPAGLRPASAGWEVFLGCQTIVGVIIAGLFGFVLGNKLRSS